MIGKVYLSNQIVTTITVQDDNHKDAIQRQLEAKYSPLGYYLDSIGGNYHRNEVHFKFLKKKWSNNI